MIKADGYFKWQLNEILYNGCWDVDPRPAYKDGTTARSKYITQVVEKYDISKGEFPITTLRNTATKTGIKEILWIYQQESNSLEEARAMGINWWNNWDVGDGTIGHRYGYTVRKNCLMHDLLVGLKSQPFSRRHIMNLYQYEDLEATDGLYPCAFETLWTVREVDGIKYLDMTLIQRSSDYIMAGFINKIQYVALLLMMCNDLGYRAGVFTHFVQNLHIYDRHIDAAKEILAREPINVQPTLTVASKQFYDVTIDDFTVRNIEGIQKLTSPIEIAI